MKIAILSDIHGNLTAIEAMYEDSIKQNVEEYWFLGDLFSPGHGDNDVWKILMDMNPKVCVRGNWEDLLIKAVDGKLKPISQGKIYFAKLAIELAKRLDSSVIETIKTWNLYDIRKVRGLNFGISHNLPSLNYGQELYPTNNQEGFDKLIDEYENNVDIAIYGHIHHQLLRYSKNENLILNPGSIGQPFIKNLKLKKDLRANYMIITVDEMGLFDVSFRKVKYDRKKEYELAKAKHIPYLNLYKKQLELGVTFNHNESVLVKENQIYNYKEDVCNYISSLIDN